MIPNDKNYGFSLPSVRTYAFPNKLNTAWTIRKPASSSHSTSVFSKAGSSVARKNNTWWHETMSWILSHLIQCVVDFENYNLFGILLRDSKIGFMTNTDDSDIGTPLTQRDQLKQHSIWGMKNWSHPLRGIWIYNYGIWIAVHGLTLTMV